MTPEDPRHGTYAGGRAHRDLGQKPCRPCADAEARYQKARELDQLNGRPRMVPSLGYRRRLQALVALGHTFARIADALDITQAAAHYAAHRTNTLMRATTAAKIVVLYEAWSMTLPPETTSIERKNATYARTVARKHHWPRPLAWDDIDRDAAPASLQRDRGHVDDVAIARRMDGDRTVRLTKAEAIELVRRWQAIGRPLNECERTTGLNARRYLGTEEVDAA